jgi:chromosome partitioning protein
MGKRVLLIDADAQANLTALALPEEEVAGAINRGETIWDVASPLVSGAGDIQSVPPKQIRDNVWLLPGDIRISNFEAITPVGWTEALAGEARGYRVTSAMYRAALALNDAIKADIALIDLGPNVNALNRSVLIACDGFVVPLAPDLFSVMALPSVGQSIKTWVQQWKTALSNKPATVALAMPAGSPRPLGYLSQQFSTYRRNPTSAFQQWMERIPDAFEGGVILPLSEAGIPIPHGERNLGSLKNYGALIPTAQEVNRALFELGGRDARGSQFTKAQESREVFEPVARSIIKRLGIK